MSNQVPQIRFNGYSDDWEERKLGDVVGEIQSGNRLPKDSLTNGDVPYVVAQTKNDGVFKKIARGTLDYNGNPMKLFPGNSISFSIDNPEAMFYRNAEFYTSNIMRVIHEDHLTHEQYVFILENMKRFIRGYDWSRKFSGPVVSNLEYLQPSEEEQQKIGSFFKQLDDTIALHQRKLDLLKEQKKGYLQKMFPKNGAKVPELRFAGFADDWEERKLGDHAKYRRGSFPQPYGNKEWYDGEGAMPFVQVVDVTNKLTLVENTKQKISKLAQSKSVFVPKGKVVVTLQGSIGRVAITQYDSFVDRTLLIFEDYEKETDERFWAYTIQKKFEIEKLKAPGGTIKTITKEALSSFDVHLPKFEEQQKIGSFFKQLDDTIALHQRKLDLLKEQKKGFLQKMFV